ncbi:MAG: DUF4279 domain-containing protein [Opitutae bacterium]|nr:DUF4279 domain-containing protein [Opitutae bacterium]
MQLIANDEPRMSANECYAYFALRGFPMKPEEVSTALSLKPSDTWSAGDPHRVPGKKREYNYWRIESRIAREARVDLEDHVKDVLAQLAPCFDVAATLSKQYQGLMELVGYFHEYYPGLNFEPTTMQQLAALGVSVDCDFYYLAPNEDVLSDRRPHSAPRFRQA